VRSLLHRNARVFCAGTSLGSSTAVAGLGLLYENGVARGTAKVPRGKNLKGDWEKRYLVFEDSIRYLNIYKEVCGGRLVAHGLRILVVKTQCRHGCRFRFAADIWPRVSQQRPFGRW
jgi:hypothetical protein